VIRKCKLIFIVCLSAFLLAACSTESAKDQAGGKKEVNLLFNFATSSCRLGLASLRHWSISMIRI
jgi:peptide/nickel transport system substrate-binding protein